jgi:predicted outer membrane repeat protein
MPIPMKNYSLGGGGAIMTGARKISSILRILLFSS